MKKSKGFTLVELLSVIVLLGIIAIIIVPNFEKILSDSKLDLYNKQIEMIKASANLWALDKNNKIFLSENKEWPYIITLGDLQVLGLIENDIRNPKTNENFSSNLIIEISKENNHYIYNVNDEIVDGYSPVITLNGDASYNIQVKSTFNDPGIKASDASGNDITSNVTTEVYKDGILVESIDTQILGNYTIRYITQFKGTDQRTHKVIAVRRVKVVDTTAPVITCSECTSSEIVLESTNNYTLPEATATDNYDANVLVSKIGSFSTNIPGKKKITYVATDSSGNSSSIEINLFVVDTIAPVITSIDKTNDDEDIYTYIINATDSGSGIKEYSSNGGKTWQKSNKFTITLNDGLENFVVKDNAGNISTNQQKQEYVKEYAYTGNVQEFIAPKNGYYRIETWGASGGSANELSGGKGGYSEGITYLDANQKLYISVGGKGEDGQKIANYTTKGGYNGGGTGNVGSTAYYVAGGGGATHVAKISGLLSTLENKKSDILIVAAGGGGASYLNDDAKTLTVGHGGGLIGENGTGQTTLGTIGTATGGTQTSGNAFGQGGNGTSSSVPGGGGGYYGGLSANYSAGGGSSFIRGYAGVDSSTLTSSTNGYFIKGKMETESNEGNGKAKITYMGESRPSRINTKLNNVRYIKDCINGNSVNTINQWVELQAIKDGVNLALSKNISGGTENSSHPFSKITDGDITGDIYGSVTEKDLQCITLDLESTYDLDEIAVWHVWVDNRTFNDNVTYVSSDNSNWIELIHNNEAETSNGKRINAYEID